MAPRPFPRCAARLVPLLVLLSASLSAQGTIEVEPNDDAATATPLLPGAQAYGDITAGALDDWDWFAITLTRTTDLRAWTGPGATGQVGDTRLALADAAGNVLVEVDDGSLATHGFYSLLTAGGLPAGEYRLRVRGYDPFTVGSYTLDVVAAAPGTYAPAYTLAPVAERAEPNDPRLSLGITTPSLPFSRNSGAITAGGASGAGFAISGADYDFYRFIVTTPGLHTLTTLATPTTAGTPALDDTVVFLAAFVSPTWVLLATNDDFGGSPYSQLTWDLAVPGTYYAAVKGYYGTSAGNYTLDIIGPTGPLPTGTATVAVRTGGCPGTYGFPTLGVRPATFGFTVAPEKPVLGSTWVLDLGDVPPHAALFRCIGLAPAPAPFDLGAFGAPGCLLEVTDVIGFHTASATGDDWWLLPLPTALPLVGMRLEQQVAVVDAGANAAGVAVSNRVSSVSGILH